MQQKESIDLMNVEYEDVLHLYRGWRKSESALKDKNKELAQLKSRIAQLQDSHVKFRNQIQSLDSVKELTITLQNQLATMQQENRQLQDENRELAQLNLKAEELLRSKENEEENQAHMLRDVQLEFATLRGRYEEMAKAHKELERLAADEQALRLATESRFQSLETGNAALKEENRQLRQQLDAAALRLNQCDQELVHASEQLASLSREIGVMNAARNDLNTKEAELALARGDIMRLLRLMEHSPACKEFVLHWIDSGGMEFVGINTSASSKLQNSILQRSVEDSGLFLDSTLDTNGNRSVLRRSDLNISNDNIKELTPAEFAHLKRIHGGDPFPMTSNLMDESEYWVPSEAARLGLEFMSSKIPHASPKVIMDFLRSMNKIWLRRERRKIKRVKQVLGADIEDLRRQLSQSKPYKGVIAERQIRRLKSQVKHERSKKLTGRAKHSLEDISREPGIFEYEDQEETQSLPQHQRRLCQMVEREKNASSAVSAVSAERLLQASLNSLESMGRQIHVASTSSVVMGNDLGSHTYGTDGNLQASNGSYPNESYLRGAMWLGRNFTIISEELAEDMDDFRTKFLQEVAAVNQDPDPNRCVHRLSLLANSGITEANSMTNKARIKTREILQGAAALAPGDAEAFKHFLRALPIESALTQATPNKSPLGKKGENHVSFRSPMSPLSLSMTR